MGALALFVPVADATDALGTALAGALLPGDVVLLHGELGAGKSSLARAIIRAIRFQPDLEVPSPTFSLVQPYEGVIHADLYRLADESEIEELGLLDEPDAIVIVEWPERAPSLAALPGLSLHLAIPPGGDGRTIALEVRGARSEDGLRAALAPWIVAG